MADISQLEVNGTTYDICDATARDSLSNYVLKTGDTMTGTLNGTSAIFSGNVSGNNATFSGDVDANGDIVALGEVQAAERLVVNASEDNYGAIRFVSDNRSNDAIHFYGNNDDEYGDEIVFENGGRIIVGAGESGYNLHNALIDAGEAPGTEHAYIASDNCLYLFSHCNTIENRTQLMLYNSSNVQLFGRCGADHAVSIDRSANNGVTTTTNIGALTFQDKNSYWTGNFGNEINSSAAGKVRSFIGARNKKTDGSDVTNYLCVDVNKDGSCTYNVTNAANFRSAIWAACKPTQLYNNATGTDGTVTLSASAANYNHLIIYYKKNGDANACGSTVVYSPNGKKASLMVANYSSSTHQIIEKIVTISGTSITKTSEGYVNYQASNTGWNSGTTDTTLYIYRVEGWNE